MKVKALAAACATLAAGNALALDPSVTPDVTAFIAGSSALRAELENVMATKICSFTTGEAWVYLDNGLTPTTTAAGVTYNRGGAGSDMRAYFCTGQSTLAASLASKNILLYYRANGGSVMGTSPVANGTSISRFDLAAGTTAASSTLCGTTTTSVYTCAIWTVGQTAPYLVTDAPAIGMSDVEPALFQDSNNQPSSNDCGTGGLFGSIFNDACPASTSFATGSYSTSGAVTAQVMGIVANNALYQDLQQAQNLSNGGNACNSNYVVTISGTATTSVGVADYTNSVCRPNIGRAQLRAIFQALPLAQDNIDFSSLINGYAAASGSTFTVATGSAGSTSVLCRRSGGSGTQATFNALLLASGCQAGNAYYTGGTPAPLKAFAANRGVIENPSSGDVKTCLTSYGTTALGILSVDQVGTPQTDAFHFLKVDGGDPTVTADVQTGHYDFVVESFINVASTATAGTGAGDLGAALVSGFKTVTSKGTYLIGPTSHLTAVGTNQMYGTRGGNTCKPLVIYK